ncbi:MAG TPA: hypothetical protein VN205_02585 [Thermomonas sp.]|nr:hypothetical protein [Thermomonas sp.]
MPSFPHPTVRMLALAALVASGSLLASCSTVQARLPEGFAAHATAYPVTGHSPRRFNEPVRIGPYSALEMREGSTFSWSIPIGAADLQRTTKPYAFTLVARDLPPVEVQCLTRASAAGFGPESRRLEIDLTALDGPLMDCGLRMDGMPPTGMQLARKGMQLAGRLDAPWGIAYEVTSLQHYQGSKWRSGTPTGYRIAAGEDTVAVVDVLNAGRVHIDTAVDAEQRVYFAAAAASLLLLDPELGD